MNDTALICPECHTPTKVGEAHCKKCGVNLAVAVSMMERKIMSGTGQPNVLSLAYDAEINVTRLGDMLVRNGDITETQLQAALQRQKSMAAQLSRRTLGQILLEMGAVSREQLDLASLQQLRQMREQLYLATTRRAQKADRASQQLQKLKSLARELRASLKNVKAANKALARAKLTAKQRQILLASIEAVNEMETAVKGFGKTAAARDKK